MHEIKYFRQKEFACSCCAEAHMDYIFLTMLDEARGTAGIPFRINSGYRCHKHNNSDEVGGKVTSSHPKGCASDIECTDSRSRWIIIDALIKAGFKRIGIGKDFIHVDSDESKAAEVLWLY